MNLIFKIIICIVIVGFVCAAGGMFYITRGLESGRKLIINDVKPSLLRDGTYNGKYDSGRWSNQVNVVIKDSKITEIDIVKDVKFSKPEVTKELFNRVIQKQNSNVDAVSGATVTSKAYMKAIENALKR